MFPNIPRTLQKFLNYTNLPSFRHKRYSIEGSYWSTKEIKYRLTKPSSSLPVEVLREVFRKAFKVWEEDTGLEFVETAHESPHIDIQFRSREHGDGEPFDGKGDVLAHAFFPRYGGSLHFDDDEDWSASRNFGVDLYAVAVHEIGHALGLKHSHVSTAIMAPFYKQYTGNGLHLHNDDKLAVKRLYGPAKEQREKRLIKFCQIPYYDAIFQMANGSQYFFKGKEFVKFPSKGMNQYPQLIESVFPVEGPLDAATTDSYGNIYLFKNFQYWLLARNGKVYAGYPKNISEGLVSMPGRIDAAMLWDHSTQYFFKGRQYWPYSRFGMSPSWPRRIEEIFRKSNETPMPTSIGAAIFKNSEGFLFSGNRYWKVERIEGGVLKAIHGFPKKIDAFQQCE